MWDGLGQIRSQTSPRCPAAGPSSRGASPGMVPWLSGLNLCREMGTHPGRVIFNVWTGHTNPQGQGPHTCASGVNAAQTMNGLPGFGCCSGLGLGLCSRLVLCSEADWGFAAGWCFAAGWDLPAGVENAPGKALLFGMPTCWSANRVYH